MILTFFHYFRPKSCHGWSFFDKAQAWNSETFANVVVTMIHACDRLLYKLIEKQKLQFLQDGGIREEMSRARREYRSNQTDYNNRKTT